MRIYFTNTQKPKKAAKAIASMATSVRLSDAQKEVAIICGYRDWHDLERHHAEAQPEYPAQSLTHDTFLKLFADQTNNLSKALNIAWSDALYALSEARLLDNNPLSLDEYETVWLELFQTLHPFQEGRHAPGTIVREKYPGRKAQPGYIKSYSQGVYLITNGHANTLRATHEVVKPRVPLRPFIPARLKYVYGMWIQTDGSKVLYARDYKPIWRIQEGKRPKRLCPWEKVERVSGEGFWDDTCHPWHSPERQEEEKDRLRSYGISALPVLADVLPLLIFDPRLKKDSNVKDAVRLMEQNATQEMTA